MNESIRITSSVVRVRSHFLVKLTDRRWAIARHAIAAAEAQDDQTIIVHLYATTCELTPIIESAALLGFDRIGNDAKRISHLIELFLEKGIGTIHKHKLLTDVLLEINGFVGACAKLADQPTVLENIPFAPATPTRNQA